MASSERSSSVKRLKEGIPPRFISPPPLCPFLHQDILLSIQQFYHNLVHVFLLKPKLLNLKGKKKRKSVMQFATSCAVLQKSKNGKFPENKQRWFKNSMMTTFLLLCMLFSNNWWPDSYRRDPFDIICHNS